MGSIVSKMMGNNALAGLASSWLGDGANEKIETNQIEEIFGENKISEFAEKLGIDKGSSGGSVLNSLDGLGGAADMLKKLF